jgi:hypothetical protein
MKTKHPALIGLLLLGAILLPAGVGAVSRLTPQRYPGPTVPISKITWGKAYQKDGLTVTPGAVAASFGRFNFYCQVSVTGRSSLVTLIPQGGGELPPRTEKVFLRVNADRSVTLLQQWYPLANSGQPVQLKAIVTVDSGQLFAVLPKPYFSVNDGAKIKISTIRWGKVQIKGRDCYLPGRIRTRSGRLTVFWKGGPGRIPQLIWAGNSGVAGETDREEPLYLMKDAANNNTTTLYRERQPPPGRPGTADLGPVAAVKTGRLLGKLDQLHKKG